MPTGHKNPPKKQVIKGEENPNKNLPIKDIDYANLNGEEFKQYTNVIEGLFLNNKYDFEMWLATSVRKFKINEDNGEKEEYTFGIKLEGNKPIQTTRISLKQALELNKQVSHVPAHRGNSKYFLLAKPKSE